MFDYDELRLYVVTYHSGGEGKGDTWTEEGSDRQMGQIIQTCRPSGIETTHLIVLGIIRIRIK